MKATCPCGATLEIPPQPGWWKTIKQTPDHARMRAFKDQHRACSRRPTLLTMTMLDVPKDPNAPTR